MTPGVYTWASLTAIVVAVIVDLFVLRTGLLRTRLFWASYGIVLFFQFIVNVDASQSVSTTPSSG